MEIEKMAFYRKYRPSDFEGLVGQDYIKTTLVNALSSGHISHAYLFAGPRGTGKTSTARLIAKALNCVSLRDKYDPCNSCEFCTDINEGRLIDLIEIDAASNRGIDEVRDLKEKINFAPSRSKCKIYIIDEVHMMTKEAFNALLKTLEEPPSHTYFILATTEIHKIPETIISRCQRFDFRRINEKALLTRLNYIAQIEKIETEDKALEAICRYSDGGLRDAIGLMEQLTVAGKLQYSNVHDVLGISDISLLDELFETLINRDTKASLQIIHELHDQGSDLKKFSHEFIERLRAKLLESISKDDKKMVANLINMIEMFQDAKIKLQSVDIPQLPLEIAVIKIAGPVNQVKSEEIVLPAAKAAPIERPIQVKKIEQKNTNVIVGKDEAPSAPDGKLAEFTLVMIKEKWPRVTERISTPALKMSLKNAVPVKVEAQNLTLQFNANFHMEKVMEHEHRVELESVIKDVLGHGAKVVAEVKELEIKSVVEDELEIGSEPEPVAATSNNPGGKNGIMDEAMDIFGGEMVE